MTTPVLDIVDVTKSYGDVEVLRGIDLQVREHEAVALIGASGSGKSTLLRCIDLLDEIDDGDVFLDGEVITDPSVEPTAVRRKLGMVFQAYNLFPHLTVLENVVLGPTKAHGMPRAQAETRAHDLLGELKAEGVTMLLNTHEMGFARDVADTVCFLHDGVIHESGPPERVIGDPQQERTRAFLSRLRG